MGTRNINSAGARVTDSGWSSLSFFSRLIINVFIVGVFDRPSINKPSRNSKKALQMPLLLIKPVLISFFFKEGGSQ